MMKKLLSCLAAASALCAWAQTTVNMSSNMGLSIKNPYCELSFSSRIIAVEPPWTQVYFNNKQNKVVLKNAGSSCSMRNDDTSVFELTDYSATVEKNGDVLIKLDCKLNADSPAFLEYTALTIPGYLLADGDCEWINQDGSSESGHIDAAGDLDAPSYGSDFRKITVKARIGTVVIEVLEGPGLCMKDRRVHLLDSTTASCLWVGFYRADLSRRDFTSKIRIGFEPAPGIRDARPLPATEHPQFPAAENLSAIPAADSGYPMIPAPQSADISRDANETVAIPADSAWSIAAKGFSSHDLDRLNRAVPRLLALNNKPSGREMVKIVENPAIPAQGYTLEIGPDGAKISASTASGAFYGLQTMKQCRLANSADQYHYAHISDRPDQQLRSVHLCLDAADRTYFDLVEKVFAPCKINAIIGEVEYVQWDAAKKFGIQWKDGMTKAELAEFIKLCDDNFIDFIPLMQTLGHCEWMFQDGKNLDMAEDPATPYAYDVSNPKVYELTAAILDELFALGDFKYLHIGHDEVNLIARYPHRPENIKKGMKKCVMDDIMFYYDYAKKHGARPMMWHDMIMAPGESGVAAGGPPDNLSELRKDLPKDVVICVWRYEGSNLPEFKLLKKEGFDTIGCSWYGKDNPESLCRQMKQDGGMGLMVTTWAGYFGSKELLRNNFYQVEPYVRGAAWAWRTDADANKEYDFSKILFQMVMPGREKSAAGTLVDISDAANLTLDQEKMPFMKPGSDIAAAKIQGGINFKVAERNGKNAAITFKSRLYPDFPSESIPVMLNRKAKALYVLSSPMGFMPPEKARMGQVKLVYADGTAADFPVRYGIETGNPEDDHNFYLRPENCSFWNPGNMDKPYKIWGFRIENPHPDKDISKVEFSGSPDGFPWYVLGLTLED
ncbi:MAG: glycoside hydrolase family 20 zincin-like fold domain-containing protein [Victivallaceae bacterium]